MMRCGLIGFGKIAESTHLPALAKQGWDVVAIVDASPARLAVAETVAPRAKRYTDASAMLAAERLDLVDICTPPHVHFPLIAQAIEAGAHVFCEKPLVLTLDHGAAISAMAKAADRSIVCVHNWTQAPLVLRMIELAQSGALGAIERVAMETIRTAPAATAGDRTNWRIDPEKAGGGIMFDHGWHGMSILLRMANGFSQNGQDAWPHPPQTVTATTERRRYQDLPVEDTVDVQVLFAGGITGRFFATWAGDERSNRIELVGSRGRALAVNDRITIERGDAASRERERTAESFADSLAGGGYRPDWTAGILSELRQELESPRLRGRGLAEALACLSLLRAAYASAASTKPVSLQASDRRSDARP